jgi:hypothetical protein
LQFIANVGKTSSCLTEKGKAKREERVIDIVAVLQFLRLQKSAYFFPTIMLPGRNYWFPYGLHHDTGRLSAEPDPPAHYRNSRKYNKKNNNLESTT